MGARIVIRDDGKPFNPLEMPVHERCGCLADAKVGGLGIHLIRCLMARCDYRREGGINVLTLEAQRKLQPGNA
jgi:serine/threonine-protein kinase RsbW